MAREDFEGQAGGGGAFAEYDFTVTDAIFLPVENYMDGKILFLHWYGISSVEGWEQMTADSKYHPSFALSGDWVSIDGGKTVQYQGSARKPRLGKRYGMMLEKVNEVTADLANTPQDPLNFIDPKVASTWIGTKWHLERYMHDFKGQIGEVEVEMPVAYLGRAEVSSPVVTPVTAVPAAPAAPVAPPVAPVANGAGDLRGAVIALAQASNSYEEFRGQALAIPSITTDPNLVTEIMDQVNGIFAQVKA